MALAILRQLAVMFFIAYFARLGDARRPQLTDSDFVQVRGTCSSRMDLAHATAQAARSSNALRTVYVLDDAKLAEQLQKQHGTAENETYLYWPDRPDPKKPGDTRVALAPWLAHKALGETYKWFLYGDDDTFFFVDTAKRLLQDYDPELPYIVTDALWHKRKRYLMEAPRCLPCHVSPAYVEALTRRMDGEATVVPRGQVVRPFQQAPVPPVGCPCTPELACEYTLNVTGHRKSLERRRPELWSPESRLWGFPRGYPTKCDYPHFHGGSGVLVSVGAMRKVSYEAALKCYYDDVANLKAEPNSLKDLAHGDRMTSLCFWLHGVAATDPGLALSKQITTALVLRVMDSRAGNVEVLRQAAQGNVPEPWALSIVNAVAAHVGHMPHSLNDTLAMAELYPRALEAAIQGLKVAGRWGHTELDAQVAQSGLTWGQGGWRIDRSGEGKREGSASAAAGGPTGERRGAAGSALEGEGAEQEGE